MFICLELSTLPIKLSANLLELFRFDDVRTSWDCLQGQPSTADWLPIHIFISMVVTQWDCPWGQSFTADWLPILIFISMVVTQWDCLRDQPCTADWLLIHIFISMVVTQWDCLRDQPCTADWLPILIFISMVSPSTCRRVCVCPHAGVCEVLCSRSLGGFLDYLDLWCCRFWLQRIRDHMYGNHCI